MRCELFEHGLMRAFLPLAAAALLAGCATVDHSNTLLFATNTNLGIQAGTDAANVPAVNIGYRRQEAVIMPLVANVRNSANARVPCFSSTPVNPQGDTPAANTTTITVPNDCKLVGKNSDGNLEDAYSVLASFGATFSGRTGGTSAEGQGGLAQYFATGAAAQILARTGGAAVVAVSDAARASAELNVVANFGSDASTQRIQSALSTDESLRGRLNTWLMTNAPPGTSVPILLFGANNAQLRQRAITDLSIP